MNLRISRFAWRSLKSIVHAMAGALVVLVVVLVVYLQGRPDLEVWHLENLDEEFRADSAVETFSEYLALENRLFAQLDELVYGATREETEYQINRYDRGSLSDPGRWPTNWNRSYELLREAPEAGVLLLHGLSDSPYSLRDRKSVV